MVDKVIGVSLISLLAVAVTTPAAPPCAKKAIHIRLHGAGCSGHEVDHDQRIQLSRVIEEPIVWRFTNTCPGVVAKVTIKQLPNAQPAQAAGNAFDNCAGTGDFTMNAQLFNVKEGRPTVGACTTRTGAALGPYQFEIVISGNGIQPRNHRIAVDVVP